MGCSIALCIAVSILLVTKSSSRTWEASHYKTGFLIVTDVLLEDCHTCLIQKAGLQRLILVKNDSGTLTYLVEGRAATQDLISFQCIDTKMCELQTDTRQFPSWIESHRKVSVIEYSISVLSIQIDSKVSGKPHTDTFHEINPISHSCRKIGAFFFDGHNVASLNVHSLRNAGNNPVDKTLTVASNRVFQRRPDMIPRHPIHASDPRCFVCLSCSFQCERCLALHSTSFGIRTYYIKFQASTLQTVYALESIYDHASIFVSCGFRFCPTMESLSEEACDKIDQIFSKDKIALEVAGTSINEAFEIFYRNNKVTGIDGHHGYQNQADKQPLISSMEDILFKYLIWNQKPPKVRKTGVLPGFLKTQQSRQAGKVLTGVFDKCAHLYAYPNSRHECINCMFHSINTDMIISTISQTEVMVFFRKTDISATVDCIENKVCARIERRLPVDCYTHRMYHKFNPNVYPELSIFESLQLDERFCAVISHTAVNQNYCTTCVKRTSPTKTHELVSERYSVLLSSITENKGYGWHELERTLRECYGGAMTKCAKMQLVSEMICSEHKQYKESLQSGDRLCKDTREKLRMGKYEDLLWPPSNTVAHGNTIFDERAVLMVEFEARRPEMCIRCMVLRTEVFYFSVMSHHHKQFGYLWMTQNHKSILEYCLGELICTDLWLLKKSSNLVIRRSGLRPLCNGDLDLLFL